MLLSRSLKKMIVSLTVIALLVTILPMAVLAVQPVKAKTAQGLALGHIKNQEKVKAADQDEVEDPEEDDGISWRAEFVHARNLWAKEEANIPPGHANLMLKYLIAQEDMDPETAGDGDETESDPAWLFEDYMDQLMELMEEFYDEETGRFDVKAFKAFAGMQDPEESEPETTEA